MIIMANKRNHDEYVKLVNDLHPNIEVLGQYTRAKDKILVRCKNDGYEWNPTADQLLRLKCGCPVCSGRKVMAGINDLNTLRPDLQKYLLNVEDGEKYRPQSNRRILVKCPNCGQIKDMYVHRLSSYGFSCQSCSDGISYPNKFIRCLLRQLQIEFEPEKTFEWSDNKRYDQYLPNYKAIIENHGKQHYEDVNIMAPLVNQQKIDSYKKTNAINHGIKYIELNCSESSLSFIKNSVMTSDLPEFLNFGEADIDWKLCDYMATKSKIIDALELLNGGMGKHEIADILEVSKTTLNEYVRKLVDLNLYTIPEKIYHPSPKQEEYFSTLKERSREKLMLFLRCKDEHPDLDYLEISKIIEINPSTIRGILKKAFSDGIIDYDVTEEVENNKLRKNLNLTHPSKTVYVYDNKYNFIAKFNSVSETAKNMGNDFHAASIYATCNNKQLQYKGYHFSYTEIVN